MDHPYDGREEELPMRRLFMLSVIVLTLASCASSPPRAQRSEFEDIPVPRGLSVDIDKSTIIESPSIKAARIVYKGRLEPESLATAFRTTLESNGWRHLSSTMASGKGITQIYDKPGSSLQIMIYEGMYYTWVELSTTKVVTGTLAAPAAAPIPTATPVPPVRQ